MLVDKRLLALSLGHRGRLTAVTAVLCLSTMSYWAQAWFLAQALAALAAPSRGEALAAHPAIAPLGAVLLCGLLRCALLQLHSRLAVSLGAAVRRDLRKNLLDRLLQPDRLHDTSERTGARRLALTEGVDGVDLYLSQYIPHALQLQILCPVLLVGIAFLNPWLALVLVAAVLVAVGAPRLWGRLLTRRGRQHWDSYEELSADFLEALQGMRTLKILHAVPGVRARLDDRSDQLHRATVATMRVSLADTALTDLGIQAGLLAAAALASFSALGAGPPAGVAGAAVVYFMLLLSSEVFRPVRDLARQWHAGYLGLSALGSIDAAGGGSVTQATSAGPPDAGPSGSGARPGPGVTAVAPVSPAGGRLVLDGLSFRYSAEAPWVLRDAQAELRPGGITALAGASGAGKSTLFDLLLGFLPAAEGRILLDGRPLLRSELGVVSQRSYLFPGTLRENLTAVNPAATDEDLLRVLRQAGLAGELDTWADGLDTVLSEAGGSVSGGQLQRLAIARALLADRPVLLLDEPTSALNPELAEEVLAGLRDHARERTVLMIAHRPEAIAAADTVLHLSDAALHQTTRSSEPQGAQR
ncbi:ATP-binding cassette domain-containing protein [Arthrobacter sp. Y-9]|uniref:ABC transporter ATP-binding protein/permease n=1 Tax=Arthrobacter sp. Y-9 TaxID=3039385 RepID=UPI00241D15F0|nr:ATP-binding cassette domain-containing protein [Arthrobacter sp. Y-9]WFR83868.1 ATP-binding cassette domain-containing protein [Arthrobacter sp. Y-9]